MSIKTAIVNAPVYFEREELLFEGDNIATIKYQGKEYHGIASCHDEDKDFYSEKVGKTIAHMRAIKKAFVEERDKARNDWKALKHAYDNAMQNIPVKDRPNCHEDKFLMAVYQAENRYKKYRNYVREIGQEIHQYLKDQDKAISSIKRQREAKAAKAD